jgi:catechol 2,3-dioxygenase-like lactoylglutathione lyase family enzyme
MRGTQCSRPQRWADHTYLRPTTTRRSAARRVGGGERRFGRAGALEGGVGSGSRSTTEIAVQRIAQTSWASTAPANTRQATAADGRCFLRHHRLRVRVGLTQHHDGSADSFDETRVGLDHLAFAVSSRDELDSWAARFAKQGVTFSPVTSANSVSGAAVIVFRDPDNIQLELWLPAGA